MTLDKATIQVGTAVGALVMIVSVGWTALSWAEGKHKLLEKDSKANAETIQQLKTSNELLKQLVQQQASLLKEAASDASENQKALIRIEAKLETRREPQ